MPVRIPRRKNDKERDSKEHQRLLSILDSKNKNIIPNRKANVITIR